MHVPKGALFYCPCRGSWSIGCNEEGQSFFGNLIQFAVDVAHTAGGQLAYLEDEVHQRNGRLHGADGSDWTEGAHVGQQFHNESALTDRVNMPFFEKKIRQSYIIPKGMELQLRCAMEFTSAGYYRFFGNALTSSRMQINEEAEICVRLSDACLGLLFEKKTK